MLSSRQQLLIRPITGWSAVAASSGQFDSRSNNGRPRELTLSDLDTAATQLHDAPHHLRSIVLNIFLTGVTGYIGGSIARSLTADSANLLHRPIESKAIKPSNGHRIAHLPFCEVRLPASACGQGMRRDVRWLALP
jgi:hypothetical protein